MSWSSSIATTDIRSGPFQIGVGAAGSEVGVGECAELELTVGYSVVEVKGGVFYGEESTIDAIVNGIQASATFLGFQMSSTMLDSWFALATKSAGATAQSVTPVNLTVVGKSLLAAAARIRFHYESNATMTDEKYDVIFPKGIIVPMLEPVKYYANERPLHIPCKVIGFYDTTTTACVVFGQNQT